MRRSIEGVLYEITDVAEACGEKYNTTWARIYQARTIPQPTVNVGRRMFYTPEDFDRILEFLGVERVSG